MSKKIKPNKLFEENPSNGAGSDEPKQPKAVIEVDENSIVGNGRLSAEDAKKLEQFEAMEKSLAALAEEKSALEAKVAEYVEQLEALKSSSDEIVSLNASKQKLEAKCKSLEEKVAKAQKLEQEVKDLRDENDQYLIKISELTFENANLTSQMSDIESKMKKNGNVPNQSSFKPASGPQQQMSRRLSLPRRDAYNPYANNGYGSW